MVTSIEDVQVLGIHNINNRDHQYGTFIPKKRRLIEKFFEQLSINS